jgi:hypothetical protein
VVEPGTHHAEDALANESILARSTVAAHFDEPGLLQELEVSCRGGPRVLKASGEIA